MVLVVVAAIAATAGCGSSGIQRQPTTTTQTTSVDAAAAKAQAKADREDQARLDKLAAQEEKAQAKADAAQARKDDARHAAKAKAESAIADPRPSASGYENTYPASFSPNFGYEAGSRYGDRYSLAAIVNASASLERATPYGAISKLDMATVVRLALRKYAHSVTP